MTRKRREGVQKTPDNNVGAALDVGENAFEPAVAFAIDVDHRVEVSDGPVSLTFLRLPTPVTRSRTRSVPRSEKRSR